METTRHAVRAADGLTLQVIHHRVPSQKAAALILHGFAEHGGRYDHVAASLAELGVSTIIPDHRGHGASEGIRGGIMAWPEFLGDVDTVLGFAKAELGQEPRVLIGHSMGGLMAASYALNRDHGFQRMILSGPFFESGQSVSGFKLMMVRLLSSLAPKAVIPTPVDPSTLTGDPAVNQAYMDDPLVIKGGTVRLFTEIFKAQAQCLAEAKRLDVESLLVMFGEEDKLVNPEATRRFFAACAAADATMLPYPGLRHEIFNEVRKDKVLGDMRAWLETRI